MPEVIYVRKRGNKLEPCALVDEEALEQFPEGKDLSVTVSRIRSTKQHRFFWAFLNKICENHDTYQRAEQLLLWLKIRLGYVEQVHFHDEQVWWTPQSISFNAMGQEEFRKFFNAALDVIVAEVIPGLNTEELIVEVEKMLGFRLTDLWSEKYGMGKQAR
jgi:hypothetical protein